MQLSWRVRLSRPFRFGSRNDLLHQRGLWSTTVLFPFLPLSVVMVERWRQDSIWKHPAAKKANERQDPISAIAYGLFSPHKDLETTIRPVACALNTACPKRAHKPNFAGSQIKERLWPWGAILPPSHPFGLKEQLTSC